MTDEKVLTKEMAEQFLSDQKSMCLGDFTSIEDGAAQALSNYDGDLELYGLNALSDAAAAMLTANSGELCLGGLRAVSDSLAEILSRHGGKKLELDVPDGLSDTAVASLSKYTGDIFLGLPSLSDSAAESLSKYAGALSLELAILSESAAEIIKRRTGRLCLRVREFSGTAAKCLSQYAGELLLPELSSESLEDVPGAEALAERLRNAEKVIFVEDNAKDLAWKKIREWGTEELMDRAADAVAREYITDAKNGSFTEFDDDWAEYMSEGEGEGSDE